MKRPRKGWKNALSRRFRKALALSWRQWLVLLYACGLLNFIRLLLWCRPFGDVRAWLAAFSSKWTTTTPRPTISVPFIAWTVSAASRHTPGGAMCLVKALTMQLLLNHYGYEHKLHIGVMRNAQQAFEAHAWIECDGRVMMGYLNNLDQFKSLTTTGRKP